MTKGKLNRFQQRLRYTILSLAFLVFLPDMAVGAKSSYYYIHVASFRDRKVAVQTEQKFRAFGFSTVTKGVYIRTKYWYRLYVGPFGSGQEARLKARELRNEGLTDYTSIQKKRTFIVSTLSGRTKAPERRRPRAEQRLGAVKPPPKRAPVSRPPAEEKPLWRQAPQEEAQVETKSASPRRPPAPRTRVVKIPPKKKPVVARSPPPPPAWEVKKKKVPTKPVQDAYRRGSGRNVGRRHLSVGAGYTYATMPTEITKRTQIQSDGTTTTTQQVPVTSDLKDDFPTTMQLGTLRVRFGLTDYLEVFGDIGGAFDDFSEVNATYGAGARLNVFEKEMGKVGSFFGAIEGGVLVGDFNEAFTSAAGNKWDRESDWSAVTGKAELGVSRSRFNAYAGGSFLSYNEDTVRKQLTGLTPPLTANRFEDELEQENAFGVYGGLSAYLMPALLLTIEGQAVNQERVSVGVEYRF